MVILCMYKLLVSAYYIAMLLQAIFDYIVNINLIHVSTKVIEFYTSVRMN